MLVPRVLTRHGAQTARYRSSFANIVNRIRRKMQLQPREIQSGRGLIPRVRPEAVWLTAVDVPET